jgi:hypothetical protein
MAYVVITRFTGLDTRRDVLASAPGALAVAENGHINQGGEFETRKAFVRQLNRAGLTASTFGLEGTDTGLMTFGSDAAPSMPTGYVYQRLQHPAVIDGVGYDAAKHAMTAAASTPWRGKAFVAATFADGKTYLYFDGTLIDQSRNGIVLDGYATLHNLALDLDRQFTQQIQGWTNTPNTPTDGNSFVYTPPGIHFDVVSSVVSNAGNLNYQNLAIDFAGTPAVSAFVRFQVVWASVGSASLGVTGPIVIGGVDSSLYTNSTTLAAGIALSVNTYVPRNTNQKTGFTAVADNDIVTIYAPANLGNYTGTLNVLYTGITVQTPVGPTPPQSLQVTLNTLSLFPPDGSRQIINPIGPAIAQVTGGTPPYIYSWVALPGSESGEIATNPTQASTSFRQTTGNMARRGVFQCQVTDNAGNKVNSPSLLEGHISLR